MGRKRVIPTGYKSQLEYDLHKGPLKNLEYESTKIEYVPETKEYTPDFVQLAFLGPSGLSYEYWYEVKGRCRTFDELKKYIAVRRVLPEGTFLRFILSNPDVKAYPQAKKMTLGEWLTKNNFEWCAADSIPAEWRQ